MTMQNKSNPKPAAELIRKATKVYPYEAGGYGTSIAEFLSGKAKLGRITVPPPTVFHEGTGKAFSTFHPTTLAITRCSTRLCGSTGRKKKRRKANGPPRR